MDDGLEAIDILEQVQILEDRVATIYLEGIKGARNRTMNLKIEQR
jgi:hypothetical protein